MFNDEVFLRLPFLPVQPEEPKLSKGRYKVEETSIGDPAEDKGTRTTCRSAERGGF